MLQGSGFVSCVGLAATAVFHQIRTIYATVLITDPKFKHLQGQSAFDVGCCSSVDGLSVAASPYMQRTWPSSGP